MGGWGPLQEDAVVGCTHRPAEPRGLQTPLAPRPQRSPHRQPGWARMRERPGLPPTDDAKWPYPAGNRRTRRGPATGTSPQSAAPGSARARGRTRPGLLYARVAAHAPSRPHARSSSGGPRLAKPQSQASTWGVTRAGPLPVQVGDARPGPQPARGPACACPRGWTRPGPAAGTGSPSPL